MRVYFLITLGTIIALCHHDTAHAVLLATDSFNYSPAGDDLSGNAGGGSFGFSTGWLGNGSFELAGSNLPSPSSYSVAGGSVTADAFGGNRDVARSLSQTLGADNTTAYFSFLMRAEDTVGGGAYGGWFGFVLRAGARYFEVGKQSSGNLYSMAGGSGNTVDSTNVGVVSGETHLFVLRVDFLFGNDEYRLYVDPAGGAEPAAPDAFKQNYDISTITGLSLSGPGAFGFDELRIGTTWDDVVPLYYLLPGDTNGDEALDTSDITKALQNFTGSGGSGKDYTQGDVDFDGDVDTYDITIALQNFTGAWPDAGQLIYDPATGNVQLDARGAPGHIITQFALQNAAGGADFNTGVANFPFPADTKFDLPTVIGNVDSFGTGFSDTWDLGNIFPTGLNQTTLASFLTSATYGGEPGTGVTHAFDLVISSSSAVTVPEPSALLLAMAGLACMGGVDCARRKIRSRKA